LFVVRTMGHLPIAAMSWNGSGRPRRRCWRHRRER